MASALRDGAIDGVQWRNRIARYPSTCCTRHSTVGTYPPRPLDEPLTVKWVRTCVLLEERRVVLRHLDANVLSCTFHVQRLTFSVSRSASHVQRLTFSVPRSASHVQRLTFSVSRSASHVQRPTFSVPRSASHVQRLTSSVSRSGSYVQREALRVVEWQSLC